jgi:hypothetical protein
VEVLDGVTASDMSDSGAQDAFREVTANAMDGISMADIAITSVADVFNLAEASLPLQLKHASRQLSVSSASIEYTTTAILESYGGAYETAEIMAADLQSQTAAAFADPNTPDAFVAASVAYGSSTITLDTVVAFGVPVMDDALLVDVISAAPTDAPSQPITKSGGDGPSNADSSDTLVAALSISAGVLMVILIGAYVMYWRRQRTQGDQSPLKKNVDGHDIEFHNGL